MDRYGDLDRGVPHGFVLVFLSSVWRAVLLVVAGHDGVALRELGQWLTSQLGLENG